MARPPQPRPALARNFRVDLGRGADGSTISEVILPRFGARPADGDVEPLLTLRRSASEDRQFHDWWEGGKPRVVTVTMLAPDMTPVLTWRFTGARPAALNYGPLDANSDDVLSETLELAFERMHRA